jgi:hypothetical protein
MGIMAGNNPPVTFQRTADRVPAAVAVIVVNSIFISHRKAFGR